MARLARTEKYLRCRMTYRYEELGNTESGAGWAKNQWHKIRVTDTGYGPVLDIAGYVTWSELPRIGIQVAGYAALTWTDGDRWGGVPFTGETRPILTPRGGGAQTFHRFDDAGVDRYRDSQGNLPPDCGIYYYIFPHLPEMQWRFFGALP